MMNIPNMLSCLRLLMTPVFAIVFFRDPTPGHWYAAGIYALSMATDALDGIIARRTGQITRLGRVLDPLADKLMCVCVLICIASVELVPWWIVAVFLVKELLMGIGALVQYRRITEVPPAEKMGKVATVFFFLSCLSIMTIPTMPPTVALVLIVVSLTLTLAAFAGYAVRYVKLTR